MLGTPRLCFDVSSALSRGKRETQEDTIVADFPIGAGLGLIVLADGMGGHNAGDVASRIVVTEVYSELKLQGEQLSAAPDRVAAALCSAAESANDCLSRHARAHPATDGMGATLVGLVQVDDTLHWISIGDSVLYLLRDGALRKLNEDHSLAPQFDYMVSQGLLSEEDGRNHPDRNCLTSALRGEDIPFIDCPAKPLRLRAGDIVVAASDGLPFLQDGTIRQILSDDAGAGSAVLAERLLRAIEALDHPEQDNVCLSVLCVRHKADAVETAVPADARASRPTPAEAVRIDETEAPPGLLRRLRGLGAGLRR